MGAVLVCVRVVRVVCVMGGIGGKHPHSVISSAVERSDL